MDYFSCKVPLLLLLFPIFFLILTHFTTSVKSYTHCIDNGNYTKGSIYGLNLNTALNSLLTNVNDTGYYYTTTGKNQDKVDALVMCRADISLDTCKSSLQDAITEVLKACPNQKQAVAWQGDYCLLRYANYSLNGRLETNYRHDIPTFQNTSNPLQFKKDLRDLFDQLRGKAISSSNGGGKSMKVAVGNVSGPDFETIIGMAQCRPDLSAEDCNTCLFSVANDMLSSTYCDGLVGCRLLGESCFVRYEIRPFYNETRMLELSSVPQTPAPQPQIISRSPLPSSGHETRTIAIAAPIVGLLLVVLVVAGWIIFKNKRANQKQPSVDENKQSGDEISTVESLQYDFGKIRSATEDFSDENKLGQGGFGVVYKGKLQNGNEIAVKRLSKNSGQGDLEFKNEVLLLARLQHRNLVRLLGFSIEGEEKLLVYEYVQNASLDKFIFDPVKSAILDWSIRSKIIGGIARGMLYLHEDSRLRIIHRDLKASNVLLDGEMNPKIADFGLARLFEQDDQTQGSTSRIVGTYGYMAPEYVIHGKFSIKSDVFSFGVILLEILSGQRNNCSRTDDMQDLLSSAWKNWGEGTASNIIDPTLMSASSSIRDMLRCVHIGLLCVQENAADRPTLASVVLMLSSLSFTLAIPSEPAYYFVQGCEMEVDSINTRSESDQKKMLNTFSSAQSIQFKN